MGEHMTTAAVLAMYVMIAGFFASEFYRDAESVDGTPSWTYILFWIAAAAWPVVAVIIFVFAVFAYVHTAFKMNAIAARLNNKDKAQNEKGE